QVTPPSSETSTPPTTPPPLSVAVPVTVRYVLLPIVLPAVGLLITVVGAWVSLDWVAAARLAIRVLGWAPMSANRLMVACWIRESGADWMPSWSLSSPHAHWMVPAPNTSAPLAAR